MDKFLVENPLVKNYQFCCNLGHLVVSKKRCLGDDDTAKILFLSLCSLQK